MLLYRRPYIWCPFLFILYEFWAPRIVLSYLFVLICIICIFCINSIYIPSLTCCVYIDGWFVFQYVVIYWLKFNRQYFIIVSVARTLFPARLMLPIISFAILQLSVYYFLECFWVQFFNLLFEFKELFHHSHMFVYKYM